MAKTDGPKIVYVCQTYEERTVGRSGTHLAVKGTFPCSDAGAAQSRAERALSGGTCVGADAFSLTVDPVTEEAEAPTFIARLGKVPEIDPA